MHQYLDVIVQETYTYIQFVRNVKTQEKLFKKTDI